MPTLKPILFFISFIILVGLACGFSGQSDPTATPYVITATQETVELNIDEPAPTFTAIPTDIPQVTPTTTQPEPTQAVIEEEPEDEPLAYYVEEFDSDISSWSYFLMSGNESEMDLYTEDGYLVFDLQGEDQWVYVLYDEYYYPEVRIDVLAENRGMNTNNVSLICNYSDTEGWYEFNISNGGLYDILAYSEIDGDYYQLASGGSTNVVTGRAENLYTAICQGNQLALYINGVLEREYTDNKYNLREGQVGLSVASFDVLPILVNIDYFSISLP
jgi:hypothetical protein